MYAQKQILETARRGRIRRSVEIRKKLALQKRLEQSIYGKILSRIRKFGQSQSFLYRNFGFYEPDVTATRLTDELYPVLSEHYASCFRNVFQINNEEYELARKQEMFEVFGRQVDIERLVAEYFATRQLFLTNISLRIAKQIDKIIRQGRLDDLTLAEISRRITERVTAISPSRAALIARTETHSAISRANHLYYGQAQQSFDIKMMKQWVATNDERTRPEHRAANGQTKEMSEPFELFTPKVGIVKMQHVGDPAGGAFHSVNCRCVIIYADERDVVIP